MFGKYKKINSFLLSMLLLGTVSAAKAEVVNVWSVGVGASLANPVNSFYDSLPGHSSTIITGTLDSNNLSGVALLWVIQPPTLTDAEINTLAAFLAGGGRIAFMGEHGGDGFRAVENDNISAAVAALGGHMEIMNYNALDGGYHIASKVNGQILEHTLTEGVDTYEYAAFAPLIIVSPPAQRLMLGTDLTSVMMAYENVGPGSIFMITDQNVLNFTGDVDNDVMFANLLEAVTGAVPVEMVPVPVMSSWAIITLIMLLGMMAFTYRRRLQ